MKEYSEASLPQWAQQKLHELRRTIDEKDREIRKLKDAHVLLFESESWFTISGPYPGATREAYHLWLLDRDSPLPVCSLGPKDRLLIGRFK